VLLYHSTNLAVRTRTTMKPGMIGVVAFGPRAKGKVNGLIVHPNLMLMAAEGTKCQFVVEADYESIVVGISPTDFEAHLRARHLRDPLQRQSVVDLLVCNAKKACEFFSFGKRLADIAAQKPELFDGKKDVCAAAEVELIEMLLEAIGSLEDYAVTPFDQRHQAYSQLVQVAEEYALTHTGGPLYVTDLCKAAAVSERTLQYAFKEILGMSPVAFLQRLRLHRVRQALRAATRGTTTVSAEALKWGFWHFGEFSLAYKKCFGELPSDTLRRGPDLPRRVRERKSL